jgi:hypothetical protein
MSALCWPSTPKLAPLLQLSALGCARVCGSPPRSARGALRRRIKVERTKCPLLPISHHGPERAVSNLLRCLGSAESAPRSDRFALSHFESPLWGNPPVRSALGHGEELGGLSLRVVGVCKVAHDNLGYTCAGVPWNIGSHAFLALFVRKGRPFGIRDYRYSAV